MNDASPKIIATVVCDFERTAIGTGSRLADPFCGKPVIRHVVERLLAVGGLRDIALLIPPAQQESARRLLPQSPRLHCFDLAPRPEAISARIRRARPWNLHAWRGGAGQFTVFDEEYHPAAIAHAARSLDAEHVLAVPSHALFLDVPLTEALLFHHLHKNHEMRITYTPAAPGLTGLVLRADIALEMGEKNVLPWQLLAYDPASPQFDTLIRDACMQVDPALSKIPNRFLVDTDRSWNLARHLADSGPHDSPADLALAAARAVAPGITNFSRAHEFPRELEIELTGKRLTDPPGAAPLLLREGRGTLSGAHWTRWLAAQAFPDDLLLTFAGDGDPLLHPSLVDVLRAARSAGVPNICVQTDLVSDISPLLAALSENLVDIVSLTLYGHTAATYNKVSGTTLHTTLTENLHALAAASRAAANPPLIVPRLLKVRDTIPELEPFFDAWISQAGWAVIDAPTTRAGAIPPAAVVDMAPPKRRPCRRLWDRLVIRANGVAVACDQDAQDTLALGHLESHGLQQMWNGTSLATLRRQHADALYPSACSRCTEWHRA
jgi:radical SAM protein with 4Fe4S-binding SPASM domain